MRGSRESWGLGVFILALLAVAGVFLLSTSVLPGAGESVHRVVLPIIIAVAGAAVLSVGHFSYPRVQNLKIYLAGYATGAVSLSYLVFAVLWPGGSDGFVLGLFGLSLVNAILVATVPAFLKFHATKVVTWAVVGAEVAAVLLLRFGVGRPVSLYRFPLLSSASAAALVLAATVAFLTQVLVARGFHLRGTIMGYAVLLYGGWIASFVWPGFETSAALTFAFLPTYLTVAAVVHWFARMEHRASYDPLLQIYNRDYCSLVLSEQSAVSTRPPFTVAMVDIDHFKKVNDTYGHQAGDEVLFAVAQKIQQLVIPDGVVCRYGGEEIALFFPKRHGREVASRLEDVRREIEELSVVHRGTSISVTVSIGLSYRNRPDQRLEDVVRAADKALYLCKNRGRNQIRMVRIKERATATS